MDRSGRPRGISGLLVAEVVKICLCLNMMYVNTHMEYVPFK